VIESRRGGGLERLTTALVLAAVWGLLLRTFDPALLTLDTLPAGGDTPSFLRPLRHLADVLLPAGNPLGWDLASFAGYPPFQYYYLPPSLAILGLSWLMPLNVAFKLMTVAGTFLLPLAAAAALRDLGRPFPAPAIGAAATLPFLFNRANTMWGGNIPSTLAGEFAFSIALALAVLFLGRLYRALEGEERQRGLGPLLALVGLCHPVAFLSAAATGLFFLLGRRSFAVHCRRLAAIYGTAFLLMAFWLVPLVAKLGWATSINWRWRFTSWSELAPPILWPAFGLAVLAVLIVALRPADDDRPARYLLFGLLANLVLYLNATELGLPEIRFLPFVYLMATLLAVDLLGRAAALSGERWPRGRAARAGRHLAAALLAAGAIAGSAAGAGFIPAWVRWNYEGIESKPSYPLLAELAAALRGPIDAPRVAYEHSPAHNRFGSLRVFESMALLTGRATLEGVMLQASVTSPFVYWLQSQISDQGTAVIPGYSYPTTALAPATARLELFNAHDMIAVSPRVTAALEQHPRWRRTFRRDDYSIFHLEGADPNYVRVPEFEPALLASRQWKRDFHRWFASDGALDVPLVLESSVPRAERARFALRADSPAAPPRRPLAADCAIDERIDHLEIAFTTTCPGLPHWIAVAHYPNWRIEGARGVYLASPAFMLVYPDGPEVRLRFRRIAVDWLGIALTVIGLALWAAPLGGARAAARAAALDPLLFRLYPYLLAGAVGTAGLVTVWHTLRDLLA